MTTEKIVLTLAYIAAMFVLFLDFVFWRPL